MIHPFRYWERLSVAAALAFRWDGQRSRLFFQTRPGPYTAAALIGFLGQLKRHFRRRRATISGTHRDRKEETMTHRRFNWYSRDSEQKVLLTVWFVLALALGPMVFPTPALAQKVGNNSCVELSDCIENTGNIKNNSCNGHGACVINAGAIGNNSCNGQAACLANANNVKNNACDGDFACVENEGAIGNSACVGFQACSTNGGVVGNNSCKGDEACFLNSGTIGNNACVGIAACRNNSGNIGSGQCIGDHVCEDNVANKP